MAKNREVVSLVAHYHGGYSKWVVGTDGVQKIVLPAESHDPVVIVVEGDRRLFVFPHQHRLISVAYGSGA